ncbi:TIGR03086 family metal-binding protein [Streptomyces cavernicola]|uniref:TIGR03086 family metal-binding protein n=1 Tax=Streptomyces cavernicola TaxID=3043613 RepID=A0ABT6SN59_9ACTN|nr:TIGR03086 family metal-binding protein [Streptomyces sp. B-S-A6]MDI3408863.1 TIGR03086 family metal-binding protein [Streptomyces sp. B-S-A6]
MTKSISELLDTAGAQATAVVRGIEDGQLGQRTPCSEYDVRALVNHLTQVVVQFQALAAKQNSEFGETPDAVGRGDDWRERFAEEVRRLVAAWGEPGAEEGTTGAMNFPARTVGHMVLGDLAVHAWDLARATGQEHAIEPVVLAEVATAYEGLAGPARQAGVLGDPVPVPADAPEQDRLLGALGRDPHWRP